MLSPRRMRAAMDWCAAAAADAFAGLRMEGAAVVGGGAVVGAWAAAMEKRKTMTTKTTRRRVEGALGIRVPGGGLRLNTADECCESLVL